MHTVITDTFDVRKMLKGEILASPVNFVGCEPLTTRAVLPGFELQSVPNLSSPGLAILLSPGASNPRDDPIVNLKV